MNSKENPPGIFHWLAWLGGLAIAVFYALFATAHPFEIMQLIPSLFVIFVLIISWESDLFGVVGFFFLGIAATFFFSTHVKTLNFLLISLPLFIVSAFYLISFFESKNKKSAT